MTKILMLCGYTAYQAGCLAPFLWAMVAALGVYVICTITMEDDNGEIY
jgi:hypothetical protein